MSCMMDEVEVVVDGGPERVVRTDSLGAAPPAPGMKDTNASEGYVVAISVCDATSSARAYEIPQLTYPGIPLWT
jgi:hypothetical protein